MAQPFPYLDESVRLIGTPLSGSVQSTYGGTITQSPYTLHGPPQSLNGSANASFILNIFRMSSRFDLSHQPRQYFCYISVICMLYCVIYRLFFYYTLYWQYSGNSVASYGSIYWISTVNGFVSVVCLCLLLLMTAMITLIRIHNECSPDNVQILLFSVLRLCVMFVLNLMIVLLADSFILLTFISYVLNPSSSSSSNHVDMFWQSIRQYLKDAESDDDETEKMRRLITIHYYCMSLYMKQMKRFNSKEFNAGIFGRKQQQIAIRRLRPIVWNEFNQNATTNDAICLNRFGISTPQSLSSYHAKNALQLKHHDLQIWFSVILWMPVFMNDKRYSWYWIIEKVVLRIAFIAVLACVIYTETVCALPLIPIYTAIRCVLEVINLLNLIPFVIFDDPDFDNLAELYSSRELSSSITKRKRCDIVHQINKTYHHYCCNVSTKQQHNINPQHNQLLMPPKMALCPNKSAGSRRIMLMASTSYADDVTPAPTPGLHPVKNVIQYEEEDSTKTDFEEESSEHEQPI
eukprot:100590_1